VASVLHFQVSCGEASLRVLIDDWEPRAEVYVPVCSTIKETVLQNLYTYAESSNPLRLIYRLYNAFYPPLHLQDTYLHRIVQALS
jgi:hypothetical protein